MTGVLDVSDLTKHHGRTTAVDSLTFTVRPGRVTGFLGPNGAGKSSTMRMMLGLDRPTRGSVLFDGVPYGELRHPLRTAGALLEAKSVHPGRSGRAHLRALARTHRIPGARVEEVIELTGLTDYAGRRAGTYSLGMGQRLGIAAALLGDPGVLLLDEPVNGLDPEGIVWIRTLMREWARQGRTVFVSSHLMGEAALTVDHVVVIGGGRLLAEGGVREITDAYAPPGGSLEEAFIRLTTGGAGGVAGASAAGTAGPPPGPPGPSGPFGPFGGPGSVGPGPGAPHSGGPAGPAGGVR
ncbi:ABC transporter ATP-binding protein [Streptomyces sp. NPDC051018]|uniref:ABC transporter ATP-binding protein n=1 Tax=Streptomyces sp. NPDC051018 TaxID=3365639 RepID=UPI00378C89B3